MPDSIANYLSHILDEAKFLIEESSKTNFEEFVSNPVLKRSFVRSIEIIGEATKKVPDKVRDLETKIDWKRMAGMRDRVIHDYLGVKYRIVWMVATQKAPELNLLLPDLIKKVRELGL